MKTSEMYKTAQIAVLKDSEIGNSEKLEILAELMERESLEKFVEEKEASGKEV